MRYRPDIDGLRALAIIAVVACHAEAPGFAGGFIGVDAFFVISGFLITSLLRREQQASGRIDLAAFFARRVRRLVPALAVVLLAVLAGGALLLSPDGEQQALAASAVAVTTFVSNIFFGLSRLGYFVPSGQFLPLLHTWSLGVEEQFYIVWPLLLIFLTALAKRWGAPATKVIVPLLGLGTAASLILCFVTLEMAQSVGFYAFPTRAWELGAGALLAFAPSPQKPRPVLGASMTVLGIAMLAGVVASHQPQNIFTGAPSVIAVIAALLIIAGGGLAPRTVPSRLLGSAPMVVIGKLSYSWYLWHWPLLAFGRIAALGEASLARDALIALAALGLAALTWRYVEQPARHQRLAMFSTDRRSLVSGAAILSLCAILAGALWCWSHYRLAGSAEARMAVEAARSQVQLSAPCEEVSSLPRLLAGNCILGATGDEPLVLLIGDSHARHLAPGLADVAETMGLRVLPVVKSSCLVPPFTNLPWRGVIERRQDRCASFNEEILDGIPALQEKHGLKGVIISGMWSRDRSWEAALPQYVAALRSRGLRVAIVLDVPGYAYSVPRCYAHRGVEGCGVARADVEQARERELTLLRRIASGDPGVTLWDPLDSLCTQTWCGVMADGELLYSDRNHLSYAGSRHVARSIQTMLPWAAGREGF